MRINSSDLCLSLVLQALDEEVLPDVTTDVARNAISNIRIALNDLLKRQGPSIAFLKKCIDNGEALCREIHRVRGTVSSEILPTSVTRSDSTDFESLIEIHAELTERIDQLCVQMLNTAGSDPQVSRILRAAAEWEQSYYLGLPALPVEPFSGLLVTKITPQPPLSADFLQKFLRGERNDNSLEVADFIAIPGGYGNQTYFATVKSKTGSFPEGEKIVIRKNNGVTILIPLEQEFDLLRSLSKTDFPAPVPIELASKLPGVNGTFYTMNRIPGRMAADFVDQTTKVLPETVILRLAELLGKLHSMPLDTFADYIETYKETSVYDETNEERHRKKLDEWQKYSKEVEHPPSPFATWLFSWLKANIPVDSRRPVLNHGDFNVHNILAENGELTGVLDWELADFGAPEMDLAYVQPTVTARMEWGRFLDHYYTHGGIKTDPSSMLWCAAYSAFRLALAGGRFALNLQRGICRDVRFINVEHMLEAVIMGMAMGTTKAADEIRANKASVVLEPAIEAHDVSTQQKVFVGSKKEIVTATEVLHVEFTA